MSFRATALRHCLAAVFLAVFTGHPLWGQAANSPVIFDAKDGVTTTMVQAAGLTGANSSDFQWLKVEVHYACAPQTGNFLDAVEFRFWIEGRDLFAPDAPGKDGVAVGLLGSVTYVNVAANKDCYGVVYLHPSTLARYNAGGGSSDFDRKFNVHVEAYVGGSKMDYFDKHKEDKADWFAELRQVNGLIHRQDQTPFIVADISKYPALALQESGGGAPMPSGHSGGSAAPASSDTSAHSPESTPAPASP